MRVFVILLLAVSVIRAFVRDGVSPCASVNSVQQDNSGWLLADGTSGGVAHPRKPSAVRRRAAATSHVLFSLNLYDVIASADDHRHGNIVFSPLSVSSALHILMEGANGTTATEILSALNLSVSSNGTASIDQRRSFSAVYEQIAKSIASPSSGVSLGLVQRLFVQSGQEFLCSFVRRLKTNHRTDVQELDFERDPDGAERMVNAWVADGTGQRIKTLIPPGTFDFRTRLVAVNALCFKGDWRTQFDARRSRPMPFHSEEGVGGGSRRPASPPGNVVTMYVEAELLYRDFRRLKFDMLELPYATDSTSMFVVLPHEESSLAQVARHLLKRPALLANPRARLHNGTVSVFLPKFHLEESIDLKRTLVSMGVRRAFEQGKADLSGMDGKRELYLSDAFHKVSVEVDERGSRAAAASGLVIKGRSMNSDPVFRADRPFLFFVRHNPTSSILFFGHVKHLKDATSSLPMSDRDAVVI